MKRCSHCNALNSEKATFCWRCYKPLYSPEINEYISLERRIRERVRDIMQYRDIRELLKEKIELMAEREKKKKKSTLDEEIP
jgi:predicted amidophosphoribosyltransferase